MDGCFGGLLVIIKRILKFCIILYCNFLLCQSNNVTINLRNPDLSKQKEYIFGIAGESFILNNLQINSDILMYDQEKKYLIDLSPNSLVFTKDILRVLKNLQMKNKFDEVSLDFDCVNESDQLPKKFNLIFDIKSFWSFVKINFTGQLRDKERLKHDYLLTSGEFFNLEKHEHSLKKIKQTLQAEGYLNVHLNDKLKYIENTKSVNISVAINKLDKFIIDDVEVNVFVENFNVADKEKLSKKLIGVSRSELKKRTYSKKLIDEHANFLKKYLAKMGFFINGISFKKYINYKKKKVIIKFTINTGSKKKTVFFGNHFFSSDKLLSEILLDGKFATLIPPSLLAQDIAALYKKYGFWEVIVDFQEEDDQCFFLIQEGIRSSINGIVINGIKSFDEKLLIKDFFFNFSKKSFYEDSVIKESLDKLTSKYLQEGFWDFKILQKNFEPIDSDKNYKFTLVIDEGERSFLESVDIDEFKELLDNPIFAKINNSETPVPFNAGLMQEQKQWLSEYFKRNGYLHVILHSEFIKSEKGIKLIWRVLGDRTPLVFDKTIISSSLELPPHIITRELTYEEGDIWNKQKLDESAKKLRQLGIFEYVELNPAFNKIDTGSNAVLAKLILDDPFEIRTRVGFQTINKNFNLRGGVTYKFGGSLLWKNPFNKADILRFDTDVTKYKRDVTLCYEIPWIWNLPIRTQFKLYSYKYDQPIVVGSKEVLYDSNQNGFLVGFKWSTNHTQIGLTAGFEFMKISGLSKTLAKLIQFEPRLVDESLPYIFVEPTLFVDYLDNKLDPTKGFLTVLSLKGMFPLGITKAVFAKLLIEQSFFFPIFLPVVGAIRFRFGHIFNSEFSQITPIERFYLGGPYSIRGYEPDLAPPLNFLPHNHHCVVPVGGKTMANINVEARFPIYKQLSGVIFNDMGVLAENKITDIITNWVGATGFGLRYKTLIGPLRFDIGWKWKKRFKDDKAYAWVFTLGQAF